MNIRRFTPGALVLGLFAGQMPFATAAYADGTEIPLEQARVVTFDKPTKTVFVGNPLIADVTVIDSTHVFILGRNFGTTNIIGLDATGHEVANQLIVVTERGGSHVTLQRGPAKYSFNCTSVRCESVATPGDATDHFGVPGVAKQVDERESQNVKAADAK